MVDRIHDSRSSSLAFQPGSVKQERQNGPGQQPVAAGSDADKRSAGEWLDLSGTGELLNQGTRIEDRPNIDARTPERAGELAARIGRQIRESGTQALMAQAGPRTGQFASLLNTPPA